MQRTSKSPRITHPDDSERMTIGGRDTDVHVQRSKKCSKSDLHLGFRRFARTEDGVRRSEVGSTRIAQQRAEVGSEGDNRE